MTRRASGTGRSLPRPIPAVACSVPRAAGTHTVGRVRRDRHSAVRALRNPARPGRGLLRVRHARTGCRAAVPQRQQPRPPGEPGSAAGLIRYDLGPLLRDGVPPPGLLCDDLLYRATVHTLTGPPDCGKTTLAWHWALALLRDGQGVACFDEECGPEQTAEKLLALGATAELAAGLHYFPFPGRTWGAGDIIDLGKAVRCPCRRWRCSTPPRRSSPARAWMRRGGRRHPVLVERAHALRPPRRCRGHRHRP